MKNIFFVALMTFFLFLGCRNNDNDLQKIDQILNLYIDSAGHDMLNNTIAGSYSNIQGNDIYGLTDNAPVSFNNKKDADTVNYLEYLAGARRIPIDSVGDLKTYESRIALILTRRVNDSTTTINNDTMKIEYTSSPRLFQVSKVYYNDVLKFTKIEGEPNIVKISK